MAKRGRPRTTTSQAADAPSIEEKNEVDEYRKSTHDGRLQFFRVLMSVMVVAKQTGMIGDLTGWCRALQRWYAQIYPHCPPKELSGIDDLFKKAIVAIGKCDSLSNSPYRRDPFSNIAFQIAKEKALADSILSDIELRLHVASRELMLPLKTVDDDGIDVNAFLRDSDIGS